MSTGAVIGFALTGIAVLVFLVWTRHEVKRVDRVIEQIDREDRGGPES